MNYKRTISERLNFSFVLDGKLAGMAKPSGRNNAKDEVSFLQRQRIGLIINLQEVEYSTPEYREKFVVIDEYIPEFKAPSIEQMDRILSHFLCLKKRQGMAVHCTLGNVRTGTVLACLVGYKEKFSGTEAIHRIQTLRRGSIMPEVQRRFIIEYLDEHLPSRVESNSNIIHCFFE